MKTYREYISQIKDLFKEINADSRLTNKQIYSLLMDASKLLIFRESDRYRLLSNNSIFTQISCLPIVEAPISECADIDIKCKVYRTQDPLPALFEDSSGVLISRITSIDGWTDIVLVSPQEFKRRQDNPWVKRNNTKKIYAYYYNKYIYFPEKKLDSINVIGLFQGHTKGKSKCDPCIDCGNPCDKFLDQIAPIPGYLADAVISSVLQKMSTTYMRIPDKSAEINKNPNGPN